MEASLCVTETLQPLPASQFFAEEEMRGKREALDPDSGLLIAPCCLFKALGQSSTACSSCFPCLDSFLSTTLFSGYFE